MHAPIRRSLKLPAVLVVVYTLENEVQMAVVEQKEATERVVPRPDPEDGSRRRHRRVVVRA